VSNRPNDTGNPGVKLLTTASCRLAVILTLVPLSAAHVPAQPSAAEGLTVHEWGTFTSIAGEDGRAVEWTPLVGPDDLPCFVDRFQVGLKGLLPGTIRMETPVLYFYSPRDVTVDVAVRFRQGLVTEWYPSAAVTPSGVGAGSLRSAAFESSIRWNSVKITPRLAPDFPVEDGPSHYYAARNTDASTLEVGTEKEKFLFYRGVGGFGSPLLAAIDPDGKIVVANPRDEAIGDVILFENRDGAIGYEVRQTSDSRTTFDPLIVEEGSFPPLVELERLLMAHGLYPREAAAMVETWRDSWFEEGARLFYIVPRQIVDAILPLEVTPTPAATERVFVGRIELITATVAKSVRDAIARRDALVVRKYPRFVEAIAARVIARSAPAERERILARLRSIHMPWIRRPPASCE
jgi:hypothetical protein